MGKDDIADAPLRLLSAPHFTAVQIVAQLLSYPVGRLWARVVPNVKIFGVSINPGPFTVKEHVLITIMANVGYQSAYAVSAPSSSAAHAVRIMSPLI